MITKTLIAIFVVLLVANSRLVTVGDNEPFKKTAFHSLFKVYGVQANQRVSVSIQWGAKTPEDVIQIYLYQSSSSKGTAKTCTDLLSNTCTVTFQASYTASSGDYFVFLKYQGTQLVGTGNIVLVPTLTVSGDSSTRSNPNLLKQTFAFGQYRYHRIYSSSPKTLSVSLLATNAAQYDKYDSIDVLDLIRLYKEDPLDEKYVLGDQVSLIDNKVKKEPSFNKLSYEYALSVGYYWFVVDMDYYEGGYPSDADFQASLLNYRLSYSTQVYTCPYSPDYPDFTGVFRGCEFISDNSKLPCIDYDDATASCKACYTGYILVNGRCIESQCPAGYYKKYGQCLLNPTGCAVYSDFSKCIQCSTGYDLVNGVCNRIPLVCTGRTYFNAITWTCDKVNDKCKQWGTDGLCTSCIAPTEKPVNGVCVPIDSTCTSTQFVDAKGNCVQNDLLCETFQKYGGQCIKCVWGYQLDVPKNKCVKIICPDRYVPNDYGKCVKVSELCVDYNERGVCLGCVPTHILTIDNVCLQLETPSPCPPRFYLGDDNFCHQKSDFCEVYDKSTGLCIQCIGGYYLMYTGECVKRQTCKPRQYLINNDCHDVSPTCGNYDRANGKCLNCISENYELYYGLCIPTSSCGPRQWTDNNGNCHDVDAKCNSFNPSTGDCISCVQGYNYLNGICCVKGQYNLNGKCVASGSASNLSNSNGCRNFIWGIGCLRCDSGFQRLQDQDGFYYCTAL